MALLEHKIKVMIVDDSTIYRHFLRNVLNTSNRIEVLPYAVNGKVAIPRIKHYKPDVVIVDHEMPEMTGLELIRIVKRDYPDTEVIMFSSHSVEGAKVTIEALGSGAFDFVTKPDQEKDGDPETYMKERLLPKIFEIDRLKRYRRIRAATQTVEKTVVKDFPKIEVKVSKGSLRAVAIGISTGGPNALRTLFSNLQTRINAPIFIVQHMPPIFTKQLAESLNGLTAMEVIEAEDNMVVKPNTVYIAPGGYHMTVDQRLDGTIITKRNDLPPELSCKPSVNILFRSIAKTYGQYAMGIIMTGMGNDGYEGMIEMKNKRAYLIAQSQESCLIYGMPMLPTKEKIIHESLSIEQISTKIQSIFG